MNSIFSPKTFRLVFHFYQKFFRASILISIFSIVLETPLGAITALKFILFGLLYIFYLEPKSRQQLVFYKNFGISKVYLFVISFLIDLLLTWALVMISKLF